MKKLSSLFVFVPLLAACHGPLIGVNVEVVDEKTLLERQILGSYDELSKDLVMIASVRGVDDAGKIKPAPYLPPGKERALRAAQSREFNRDDIEQFKKDACAGEAKDGTLAALPCGKAKADKKYAQLLRTVAEEENRDRLVILSRTIESSENLTPADLPKLRKVFAQMNRDSAKKGESVQLDNGSWTVKP
ncbi:MAG: DUF1318 domain-containing protein [Pseudomonadota bacterium]